MPLGTKVGLSPEDILLDGDPAPPSTKRGQRPLPNFRPKSIVAKLLDGSRRHLGWRWSGHIVLDVDTAPVPQKGTEHPVLAHVYCGQTAGWIKTQLGTEVDLGPGHFALDGFPAAKEAQQPPSFRPMPIVATVAHLSYC